MEFDRWEVDGDVFSAEISTDFGVFEVVAEFEIDGRTLYIRKAHVDGPGPGTVGTRDLRSLIRGFAERCKGLADVDTVVLEGAERTTGARPGRRPRPLVFR